jgi:hypothetical protein
MDFARFGRFWGAPDGKIRVFRSLLRFVVVLERLEFIFSTKLIWKTTTKKTMLVQMLPQPILLTSRKQNKLWMVQRRNWKRW